MASIASPVPLAYALACSALLQRQHYWVSRLIAVLCRHAVAATHQQVGGRSMILLVAWQQPLDGHLAAQLWATQQRARRGDGIQGDLDHPTSRMTSKAHGCWLLSVRSSTAASSLICALCGPGGWPWWLALVAGQACQHSPCQCTNYHRRAQQAGIPAGGCCDAKQNSYHR